MDTTKEAILEWNKRQEPFGKQYAFIRITHFHKEDPLDPPYVTYHRGGKLYSLSATKAIVNREKKWFPHEIYDIIPVDIVLKEVDNEKTKS